MPSTISKFAVNTGLGIWSRDTPTNTIVLFYLDPVPRYRNIMNAMVVWKLWWRFMNHRASSSERRKMHKNGSRIGNCHKYMRKRGMGFILKLMLQLKRIPILWETNGMGIILKLMLQLKSILILWEEIGMETKMEIGCWLQCPMLCRLFYWTSKKWR